MLLLGLGSRVLGVPAALLRVAGRWGRGLWERVSAVRCGCEVPRDTHVPRAPCVLPSAMCVL